jgi:hypothetical protein
MNDSSGIKTPLALPLSFVAENVSGWEFAGRGSLQACHCVALMPTTRQQFQK